MFQLTKTIQLSTGVRAFHASKPLFLFGGGVIKVNKKMFID